MSTKAWKCDTCNNFSYSEPVICSCCKNEMCDCCGNDFLCPICFEKSQKGELIGWKKIYEKVWTDSDELEFVGWERERK